MKRRRLHILAGVFAAAILGVAWGWCWVARDYPSWLDLNDKHPAWWGSQAAALTQVVLLAGVVGCMMASFDEKG